MLYDIVVVCTCIYSNLHAYISGISSYHMNVYIYTRINTICISNINLHHHDLYASCLGHLSKTFSPLLTGHQLKKKPPWPPVKLFLPKSFEKKHNPRRVAMTVLFLRYDASRTSVCARTTVWSFLFCSVRLGAEKHDSIEQPDSTRIGWSSYIWLLYW